MPPEAAARIGPNAVLQMVPQIERLGGRGYVDQMLAAAGIRQVPDGTQMIPEEDAARLHRLVREQVPAMAPALAAGAGRETARYILDHRIPWVVQRALRALPARPAAALLARAIAKHAWTFVGSGGFEVANPWHFSIAHNPMIRGEVSPKPLCIWHAAVFEHLYRTLVHPRCRCVETKCGAQGIGATCSFHILVEGPARTS